MRSKANIKGHPIHPILVSFPIAFFVGAFISDILLIIITSDQFFFGQMANYLEAGGIFFAVIAAVPGIIDYFSVVPPKSSAKKRATKHGWLNIFIIAPVFIGWLLSYSGEAGFS
jgi:uncharacterized membrane protein